MLTVNFTTSHLLASVSLLFTVLQVVLIWRTLALPTNFVRARLFNFLIMAVVNAILLMLMMLSKVSFVLCNMLLRNRMVKTVCQFLHTRFTILVTVHRKIFSTLLPFFKKNLLPQTFFLKILTLKHTRCPTS